MLPTYKRDEYTQKCMKAIADAQEYNGKIWMYTGNSLRSSIIQFFNETKDVDIIAKVDNDCLVPKNWLNDIIDILYSHDVDILSPEVFPSMASNRWEDKGLPYIPATTVGGLWVMNTALIKDMYFEELDVLGIKGAYQILKQIMNEKDPKIGWVKNVIVEDMGHWTGASTHHIKSKEHRKYYKEVGRGITW